MTEPVLELGAAALNCLMTAVNMYPNPPITGAYRVGSEVAHDLGQFTDICCEGLAYVAIGDTYPSSTSFPDQDIIRQANTACIPPGWAQDIRMGIIRCVPTGDEQGNPPTNAEWNAAYVQNVYDSAALRKAACCLRSWVINGVDFWLGMSAVINRQTQINPQGGCVERNVTLTVQFPNCDC